VIRPLASVRVTTLSFASYAYVVVRFNVPGARVSLIRRPKAS
jgi:hypothetical protein